MLSGQLALITAALFTGAAIYVSAVEHPARMMLDDRSLLVQWKPAYALGALMQASLAIVGFLLGLLAWWQSGHWLWLLGALVLVANWPYTLVIIMPVNNRLKALDAHDGALARRCSRPGRNCMPAVGARGRGDAALSRGGDAVMRRLSSLSGHDVRKQAGICVMRCVRPRRRRRACRNHAQTARS